MHPHDTHNHHGHHEHSHTASVKALWIALAINAVFLVVEFVGGLLTNSLALLADAGHMLTDVGAMAVALIAGKIALRPSTPGKTYGYGRVKILAALFNGLSMWLIVGIIIHEAIDRFRMPPEVKAEEMLIIAVLGLLANFASAMVLMRHQKHDLNIKGAYIHLIADSLGSVAAIVAGIAMILKGWFIVDPIVSIVLSVFIIWSSYGIIRESLSILLEGTPQQLDTGEVKVSLEELDGVKYCHDLHIWSIADNEHVLTAHLVVEEGVKKESILNTASCMVADKYGISHSTIQLETAEHSHPEMGCGGCY